MRNIQWINILTSVNQTDDIYLYIVAIASFELLPLALRAYGIGVVIVVMLWVSPPLPLYIVGGAIGMERVGYIHRAKSQQDGALYQHG